MISLATKFFIRTEKAQLLDRNLFKYKDTSVLKSVGIYEANASGKSNVIKTIRFCNALIFESHRHNQEVVYNFEPFKFDGYHQKPSKYFIRFIIDQIEYEYSFSLNKSQILSESLYYFPKGRRAKVFTRDETLEIIWILKKLILMVDLKQSQIYRLFYHRIYG